MGVTFEGHYSSDPNALEDDETFWAVHEEGTGSGEYEIKISHNDCPGVHSTATGTAFEFVHVLNTDYHPSGTNSSSGSSAYTLTSCGGDHDGGSAKLEWGHKDSDSVHLNLGIGDSSNDVQPDAAGSAQNYVDGSSEVGTQNTEWFAGMYEKGKLQIQTSPEKDMYSGTISVVAEPELTAKAEVAGYVSLTFSLGIGPSYGNIISLNVGTYEVNLYGKQGTCVGIGFLWDGERDEDVLEEDWQGFPLTTDQKQKEKDLCISPGALSYQGTLPLDVELGFSAAVTVKDCMVRGIQIPNPKCYARITEALDLDLEPEGKDIKYFIIGDLNENEDIHVFGDVRSSFVCQCRG